MLSHSENTSEESFSQTYSPIGQSLPYNPYFENQNTLITLPDEEIEDTTFPCSIIPSVTPQTTPLRFANTQSNLVTQSQSTILLEDIHSNEIITREERKRLLKNFIPANSRKKKKPTKRNLSPSPISSTHKKKKKPDDQLDTNVPNKTKAKNTLMKCTSTDDLNRTKVIFKRFSNDHKVNLLHCYKVHAHTDLDFKNALHVKAFKRRHDSLIDKVDHEEYPRWKTNVNEPKEQMESNWNQIKDLLKKIIERDQITSSTVSSKFQQVQVQLDNEENELKQYREQQFEERKKSSSKAIDLYVSTKNEEQEFRKLIIADMETQTEMKTQFLVLMKEMIQILKKDGPNN